MPARKLCDRRDRSKAGRRGLVVAEIVGFGAQVNQEPRQILRKENLDPEQEIVGSLHTVARVEVGESDLDRRISLLGEARESRDCLAEQVRSHCLALAALDR